MKRSIFYCIVISLLSTYGCFAQKKAVYTVFLEEAVPANGTTVVFNAPILRWPRQKGKQVKYDVEFSQDSIFSANVTTSVQALEGAVFNPHQALKQGKWFWHYRVSGKPWSTVMNFIIDERALPMVSPTANNFLTKVPESHPRILLKDPFQDIKKFARQTDAVTIIEEAEKVLGEIMLVESDAKPAVVAGNDQQDKKLASDAIIAFGNRLHKMVLPLCQAYLLTANNRYATKAIDIALETAKWDAKGISGSRDFTDGICMYDMALVFDTFYDQLSTTQREILLKSISERAGQFYKSWVNNIESKVLSGHVWQLILNEFFNTAVALYHHEPDAAKWLSYAYELFLARAPVLGGLEGGWAEGASYFTMNMETLVEIPERIKNYTGFDFINAHPWYKNQADWLVYHFPPGSSADGFGDNTEELFEPPVSYAAFAHEMARLTQIPTYDWYAKKIQQVQKADLSKEPILKWSRLIHSDASYKASVTDSIWFPLAHLSKETGIAALHTDPANTKKDVMVAMRASPFGAYGHILADQNTFNILYGGKRLFYRTGYKVAMDDPHRLGWSKHTKSQNGVLINGEGQPYSVEANGYFSRFLQGNHLAYMKGDASNAYQSKETKEDFGLTKFYRHIVLLKPGIIVIYDELESVAGASWSWLIHSIKNMKLDSLKNTFTSTIENAKGIGKLWSSQPFTWNLTNKFDVPAVQYRNYPGMKTQKYEDTQWHLKAVNNTGAAKIRFLSVIQVSENGKVMELKESGNVTGVQKITLGDWEIEATMPDNLPPQLAIQSLSGKASFVAYGNAISFKGNVYKGEGKESSKLVEYVNGKINFVEAGDEPLAPIR